MTVKAVSITIFIATIVGCSEDSVPKVLGINGTTIPIVNWQPCSPQDLEDAQNEPPLPIANYQCAKVKVPLSYRKPRGEMIEVAIARLPTTGVGSKIGTIFTNPGGPGGGGRFPVQDFNEELRSRFDIVGMDPRGTASSSPIRCATDLEQAESFGLSEFPLTPAQESDAINRAAQFTAACDQRKTPMLSHMSTANVARDLEVLRQAVGDESFNYIGFSYGTFLGEVYANLFPEKVRAMILDGVLDPALYATGRNAMEQQEPGDYRQQAHSGSAKALQSFLADCAADSRCEFGVDGGDLPTKYNALLQRLRAKPVTATDPRTGEPFEVNYQTAVSLTAAALAREFAAPILSQALQEWHTLSSTTAHIAQQLPPSSERESPSNRQQNLETEYKGGFYEWSSAVLCSETEQPSDPSLWAVFAAKAEAQAGPFGRAFLWDSLPCATWPVVDEDRYTGPWNLATANPILVIGNRRGDPATPFEGAQSTSLLLGNARLLTFDGYGHTAVATGIRCVDSAADRYLIDLSVPADGAICGRDRSPFEPLAQ
jgi:pimeloyl-ACP methyl ester carboxylesterase